MIPNKDIEWIIQGCTLAGLGQRDIKETISYFRSMEEYARNSLMKAQITDADALMDATRAYARHKTVHYIQQKNKEEKAK